MTRTRRAAAAAAPATPPEDPEAKLDAEIDKDTKAPEGVRTASSDSTPAVAPKVKEVKLEDGTKVRRLAQPTGHFVAVDNEIFNREGVHVGTEANANVAARKADRFNSQTRRQ